MLIGDKSQNIEPLAKLAFSSLDLEIRFFSKIGFLKPCVFRVLQEPLYCEKTCKKHSILIILVVTGNLNTLIDKRSYVFIKSQ